MNSNFRDLLNLVSKFSIQRIVNLFKVLTGYFLSRLIKRPIVFGHPLSVSIEPTTSCNLRCPECPSGLRSFTRQTGMLEENFFKNIADQLYRNTLYLVFYFQGEPFLNPQFIDMIKYSSTKKIYTATSTNAHYLDDDTERKTVESGLDRLIISIDGTTQETYQQYRIGGSLNKVLTGAKNIVTWKKKLNSTRPYLVFQFLVVHPNEHQIEDAKQLAKEIGVDKIVFKTAQIMDYQNGNALMPQNEKYSRYKKNINGEYKIKNRMLNHCWRLWHSSVITWDGNALPCCFDKDAKHTLGNLKETTFSSIWKSERYTIFRQSVLKSRKEIDICTNCTEGTKVWS